MSNPDNRDRRAPRGRTTEPTLNEWVAQWVAARPGRNWEATAEKAAMIQGSAARPDLLVQEDDRMPAVVEFEIGDPAVEDATRRLGATLVGESRPFTEVLAVGYDAACRGDDHASFRAKLDSGAPVFTVRLVSGRPANGKVSVWPEKPLSATAQDLIAYIEYLQVPQELVDEHTAGFAARIRGLSNRLYESILMSRAVCDETMLALKLLTGFEQEPASSKRRPKRNGGLRDRHPNGLEAVETACTIWLVAIDLHNDLAGQGGEIRAQGLQTTQELMGASISGKLLASVMRSQWAIIAAENYQPVIEVAESALRICQNFSYTLPDVLTGLSKLSEELNALQSKHIHNFAGELWQQIVPDKEERASHYTKPAVAELLATLAAQRFAGRSPAAIKRLNLLDAACGTGTLLGAGERALRRHYRAGGGHDADLHQSRMENHLYAMDVNGIAGTLTAKRLTDLDLQLGYRRSKIAVVTHDAGALILLDPGRTGIMEVLGYQGVTPTTGPSGEPGLFHVEAGSIDWVLMNPPYSRPRRGRQQATTGLGKLRDAARRAGYEMAHGVAGIATDFGDLSNIRLKPGGVFSHVLPLTAARASSWQKWRRQLERDFEDIVVVHSPDSMSADTNLGEILVVATKRGAEAPSGSQRRDGRDIVCVNLSGEPATLAEGYALAQEIAGISEAAGADNGELTRGTWMRTPHREDGSPWSGVGNLDLEYASIVASLLRGEVWDSGAMVSHPMPFGIAALESMVEIGPTHDQIGHPRGGDGRGAFEWSELPAERVHWPAQVSMWAAIGDAQSSIVTQPTHGGHVVRAELARELAERRSHWFIKRGMRWTSQRLTFCHTVGLTHGGRAWTALAGGDADSAVMQAVALFMNSTFGAILLDAYGSTQQLGRAALQVNAIAGMPCPDFGAEDDGAQRARDVASEHWDELSRLELLPFSRCFEDANRAAIDSVVAAMLGFDPRDTDVAGMLNRYRVVFARQPNVSGGQRRYIEALREYEAG